jgi:hypothetical protein
MGYTTPEEVLEHGLLKFNAVQTALECLGTALKQKLRKRLLELATKLMVELQLAKTFEALAMIGYK